MKRAHALLSLAALALPLSLAIAQAPAPKAEPIAYGKAPLETLDFYRAPGKMPAPLVVFVHGGGWERGDKASATGATKIGYFRDRGYAFASIDYPLVPQATVETQAQDIADAIASLVRDAPRLGIDPRHVVLMGHSAGAHLAALVGTDPQYLAKAGLDVRTLAGVVLLDGAAYDIPKQLTDGPAMMQRVYAEAFGTDPARQRALSPTFQAAAPNAPAFLILHIDRPDGARQSQALADALAAAGVQVELHGVPGRGLIGHMQINRAFGDPGQPATGYATPWFARVMGR